MLALLSIVLVQLDLHDLVLRAAVVAALLAAAIAVLFALVTVAHRLM